MGLTDRSRQQSALRQQSKQQLNQLESKAESSIKPNKAEIIRKIRVLQTQAEKIDCEQAYVNLTAQIRNLSSQL